jgi:hypothetical protein
VPHTPPAQISAGWQVFPHAPQWAALLCGSTQTPPQQAPLRHSPSWMQSSPLSPPVGSQAQVSPLWECPGGHCATHTLLQQSKPLAQQPLLKQAPSGSPQQTSPLVTPLQQSVGSAASCPSGRQFVQKPSMQNGVALVGLQQPLAAHDSNSSAAQQTPLRLASAQHSPVSSGAPCGRHGTQTSWWLDRLQQKSGASACAPSGRQSTHVP